MSATLCFRLTMDLEDISHYLHQFGPWFWKKKSLDFFCILGSAAYDFDWLTDLLKKIGAIFRLFANFTQVQAPFEARVSGRMGNRRGPRWPALQIDGLRPGPGAIRTLLRFEVSSSSVWPQLFI